MSAAGATAAGAGERRFKRLRLYNAVMGVFHAVQGVAILLLATDFTLPVTATFLEGPPGTAVTSETLFDVSVAGGVIAFVFLSALAHFIIATVAYPWYVKNLKRGRNYARWIEYSLSSSIMIVLISMLTGILDIAALLAIAGVNASMILFGLLQEHYEDADSPDTGWLPFVFGCIAGIVPWLAVALYIWSPTTEASPPDFVIWIFVSIFVFFNSFALNQWLQYKQVGKWRDYLFGESAYVLLSLVAKSALAWQVFGGTLAP